MPKVMEQTATAAQKRVTVLGATGRTGRKLAALALTRGDVVTVLVRDRGRLGEVAGRVNIVEGTATDPVAVSSAIPQGTDVVFSTLGHSRGSPKDLESVALRNVIDSMKSKGVRRLVVLASSVVKDPGDDPSSSQRLILTLMKRFRRDVYDDSVNKARIVMGSSLEWTIIRASILTNGPAKGNYKAGPMNGGAGVRVSRSDMAEFMLKCADEGLYHRSFPYVSG